jgi:hypothetical protein
MAKLSFRSDVVQSLDRVGAHYARIFEMDFFPKVSKFDMLDMTGNDTREYQSVKTIDYNIVLIKIRFQGNVASVEPRR